MEDGMEEIMERGSMEGRDVPHSLVLLFILVLLPTVNMSFCNLTKPKAVLLFHRNLPR